MQKVKWLSAEDLQIAEERREAKSKEERERYTQLNAEFQRIARKNKKTFLKEQCKEVEGNNKMGKTRDLFKKIGAIKGTFHARMGMIKDRNSKDLREVEEILRYTEELYKIHRMHGRTIQKILMTQITMMVWWLIYSLTSWSLNSSGP